MKRVETSKKILIFCDTIVTVSVAGAFIIALIGSDVMGISDIVVALIGLSAAAHSFYYWKAKAENLKKYHLEDKIKMSEGNTWDE